MYRIGIDVGGTFTDFTLVDEVRGGVAFHKVPSTPHDPSEAIQNGIVGLMREREIRANEITHIGHGTTVAGTRIGSALQSTWGLGVLRFR